MQVGSPPLFAMMLETMRW